MKKGENIFKRKDGRWEARYIKGYELSGKIKYGFCYGKTYKEAKEKVAKFKAALVGGANISGGDSRHRLGFYCDEWLQSRKCKVRESTYVKYKTVIEKHIKPKLGSCFPLGINAAIIDAFSDELISKDGLSEKTAHDILVVLQDILKYTAVRFPGIFPMIEINFPKSKRKEMRVLSYDEQKQFALYLLDELDSCKFGVLLMMFTGIRIGELCALRWLDIDAKEKIVSVGSTMQRLQNIEACAAKKTRVTIGAPKSDTSLRKIPMTDFLTALCCRFEEKARDAYVLTGTEHYMEPRTLQYRIKKYTTECGLEGVHAHTFRHTFATRAVEVGFEIKSLSEILGHANTAITLNRYVHSSMELKRANMDKLTAIAM